MVFLWTKIWDPPHSPLLNHPELQRQSGNLSLTERGRCARTGLPLPAPADRLEDLMFFSKYEFYLAF